jgi:hypothetical protein
MRHGKYYHPNPIMWWVILSAIFLSLFNFNVTEYAIMAHNFLKLVESTSSENCCCGTGNIKRVEHLAVTLLGFGFQANCI